jgi:hypothetical protein
MAQDTKSRPANGPMDRLKSEALGLIDALGDRAVASVRDRVDGAAGRLTDYVEGGAGPGLMAAMTGAKGMAEGKSPSRSLLGAGMAAAKEKIRGLFGGGRGQGKKQLKLTNIVESIDVGVPIDLAYNQWTQFTDFPTFMKKVESVDQSEDEQLEGSGLLVAPDVGIHDPGAGPRGQDPLAVQGHEGLRRRRGDLPRTGTEPDAHPVAG